MTEQSNLPTQRVNISTQKIFGGIGIIILNVSAILLILLSEIDELVDLLDILNTAGFILLLISQCQLSYILGKPIIFRKVLIGLILSVVGILAIAFAFGIIADKTDVVSELDSGTLITSIIAFIIGYVITLLGFYFYKEAYDILAQAIAHNLFKIAGLLMFIGAITIILFGLGLLLIIVGEIILAVAFFTAPNEVEVQGT